MCVGIMVTVLHLGSDGLGVCWHYGLILCCTWDRMVWVHVGIMVIVLHLGTEGLGACWHYGYCVTFGIGWSGCMLALWLLCCTWDRMVWVRVGIMVIVLRLGSDGLGACWHYGYYVALGIGWSGCVLALWLLCYVWDQMVWVHVGVMVVVLHLGSEGLGACWHYGYYVALGIGWSGCVLALWLMCCTWDRIVWVRVGIMVIMLHLGSDGLGACWHYGYYVALGIGWSGCVLALWLLCCTWDRMVWVRVGIMVIVLHFGSDGLGGCWYYGYYVALGIGWSGCVLALWLLCCTWDRMVWVHVGIMVIMLHLGSDGLGLKWRQYSVFDS